MMIIPIDIDKIYPFMNNNDLIDELNVYKNRNNKTIDEICSLNYPKESFLIDTFNNGHRTNI